MSVNVNHYKTSQLALCAYLEMNGLRFVEVEAEVGINGKEHVVFVFEDPQGIGQDLTIDFRFSEVKKYRDLTFFYRNEIESFQKKRERK